MGQLLGGKSLNSLEPNRSYQRETNRKNVGGWEESSVEKMLAKQV